MQLVLQAFAHKTFLKRIVIVYHLIFPFFIWYYSDSFLNLDRTDADNIFYLASLSEGWFELFGLGTQFMVFLSYPFVKMGMSHLALSVLFSMVSLMGFLIYINLLYDHYKGKKGLVFLLSVLFLLIPSLHFWTSFIGKDAVIFYLMALILSKIIKNKHFSPALFAATFLILLIRPYLFFIVLFGYGLHIFLNVEISPKQKKRFIITALVAGVITLPVLQKFLKLDHVSLATIKENFAKIVTVSQQQGGSFIDLARSTYLERLFIVLFRPFFYDARTLMQFIASAENAGVWALMFILIKTAYTPRIRKFIKAVIFPLSISVLLILFYSLYMYNLGLASRMRIMFLPYIFFILFWIIKMKKEESYIRDDSYF